MMKSFISSIIARNVGLGLPQWCSGQNPLPAVRICHLRQSRTGRANTTFRKKPLDAIRPLEMNEEAE